MRGLLKTYQQKQTTHANSIFTQKNQDYLLKSASPVIDKPYERKGSQDHLDEGHDKPKTKEEIQAAKVKERQRLRIHRANQRRDDWIDRVADDPDFIQGFQQGSLPLVHMENMRFRDFSAPGITGLTGSIPKTSMEKFSLHKVPAYEHTEFNEKKVTNFRHRDLLKETGSPIMKYTHKDTKQRINEQLASGIPQMSTEPLNTLLLVKPMWREHDESKWVSAKDFQSQMSRKDHGWKPTNNISDDHPEPYVEAETKFRETTAGPTTIAASLMLKRRNMSSNQVRTQAVPNSQSTNLFKASPQKSIAQNYEESTPPSSRRGTMTASKLDRTNKPLFDSTVPHDKTWMNRAIQSNSLRQKHHLNQSLKLRKNLQQGPADSPHHIIDMHAEIAKAKSQMHAVSPLKIITTLAEDVDETPRDNLTTPTKPLSPISQEGSMSPMGTHKQSTILNFKSPNKPNELSVSQKKKPPLPKKEQHLLSLDKVPIDIAASYLNNECQASFTNTWQYNVVVKAPHTYHNKKFEEKEELRESHILWEMDREKTYYRSALEKINPQSIKNQVENEKLRRTNMMMCLNGNIMDKTSSIPAYNEKDQPKESNFSLKKLQMNNNFSAGKRSPLKNDDRQHTPFNGSSVMSSTGGQSPIKLMSMTMPKGFMSPNNGISPVKRSEMNKREIKDVVKSYFDRTPASPKGIANLIPPSSPYGSLPPPTAGQNVHFGGMNVNHNKSQDTIINSGTFSYNK